MVKAATIVTVWQVGMSSHDVASFDTKSVG